ncbi:ankyrin repeats (3 copies) domain-containing protein [Ditylenchus destructor]|uniref:Ankyrin repeats (3 copies) domain-containing protein n=1 Tax=Ditylenchus destructor TaxID=166010 RepID=A0AAD4NG28_9BILA|nr:ankyrin repeats (3 copies) domain-containing protein [Ditylenchus destructor]
MVADICHAAEAHIYSVPHKSKHVDSPNSTESGWLQDEATTADTPQPSSTQSSGQISASTTSLSSLASFDSSSLGSKAAPRKPPRKYHYTDVRQMNGPVASTSSASSTLLRQPIRVAQPPPPTTQPKSEYAVFNRQPHQKPPSMAAGPSSSSMTTTFPANEGSSTAFPHYGSVPVLHQNPPRSMHYAATLGPSCASSSAMLMPGQQQRRRESIDVISATGTWNSQQSYNSILEAAVMQQRQIEANVCELEERRRLISTALGPPSPSKTDRNQQVGEQISALQSRIALDEREMSKLSAVQREARQLAHHNQMQRQELAALENTYAQDDNQLRKAVDKVDVLRKQLDLLYQRRASAASAAIAQQRKINGNLSNFGGTGSTSHVAGNVGARGNQSLSKSLPQQNQVRPQASIVPFQFHNVPMDAAFRDDDVKKAAPPSYDQVDSSYSVGRAHIAPHQHKKTVRAPPPPPFTNTSGYELSTFGKDPKRNASMHVQPSSTILEEQRLALGKMDQLSLRSDSVTAVKRRSWAQTDPSTPETENIWRYLVEEQKKGRTHISFADIIAAKKPSNSGASASATIRSGNHSTDKLRYRQSATATASVVLPSSQSAHQKPRPKPIIEGSSENYIENSTSPYADTSISRATTVASSNVLSHQNDSSKISDYQAASIQTQSEDSNKRRPKHMHNDDSSDPVEKNQSDQDEIVIQRKHPELVENEPTNDQCSTEQKLAPKATLDDLEDDDDLETLKEDNPADRKLSEISKTDIGEIERKGEASSPEEGESLPEPDEQLLDDMMIMEADEEIDMEEPAQFMMVGDGRAQNEEASSTTTDEASTISGDEPTFDEVSLKSPMGVKSILKMPGNKKHNRKVVFDQTFLFLDVAYEGDYDMLVQLASQIPNISMASSEGITALHNAICSGSHDIVRFLIDNHADVNALDSDGWSPLHCAASCNNLVMLKMLVENGACVYATTLSKSDTASSLFDESHEYEASMQYMELVERCMGVVNDAKVYAAYSYEAENDDELSFEEGDELRVLRRNDLEDEDNVEDAHWWLCEHTSTEDKQGLVPRNYLGLYPIWKHRQRHNFQDFDLPQPVMAASNGGAEGESQWITRNGAGSFEMTQTNSNNSSMARELSTYA